MADSACNSALLKPSDREGITILRGLVLGATVRWSDGVWSCVEPSRPGGWLELRHSSYWRQGPLNDASIEWLLEDGFAVHAEQSKRVVASRRGRKFLSDMSEVAKHFVDARMASLVVPTRELRRLIAALKREHPQEDHFVLAQMVAQLFLTVALGEEWFAEHVAASAAPSDFFRNGRHDDDSTVIGALRVIHLAEMIFNLQHLPGVKNSIDLVGSGKVEAGFAELEVGKILHIHDRQFAFRTPTGTRGLDYDLELRYGDVTVCADTKCKLETTALSEGTVLDSLDTARRQLPKDRPGAIFVKVPQMWNSPVDDTALGAFLQSTTAKFFRGTGRVVTVKFHTSMVINTGAKAAPVTYLAEFGNPNHRFDTSVDWNFYREMDRTPESWVSLLAECDDQAE